MKKIVFVIAFFYAAMHDADAATKKHLMRPGQTVIGTVQQHQGKAEETLIEIARKYDLGYNEIVAANPTVDPFLLEEDRDITIPTQWILPDVHTREGIVINLAEMRLYYFHPEKSVENVVTFPIGIGSEGNDTPVGRFTVIQKTEKPSWVVPKSIRKERPELPRVIRPGPENPLGSHALRLSLNTVLIHGTNKPWGVGRRVSHGCIRLYPEDIPRLYNLVSVGESVTIVDQPVKVGTRNGHVLIEVHNDVNSRGGDFYPEAIALLEKKRLLKRVNIEKLVRSLEEKTGMPVNISD